MIKEYLIRRRRYKQTVFELSQMSDRELGDIGITRYDIKRIAMQESMK